MDCAEDGLIDFYSGGLPAGLLPGVANEWMDIADLAVLLAREDGRGIYRRLDDGEWRAYRLRAKELYRGWNAGRGLWAVRLEHPYKPDFELFYSRVHRGAEGRQLCAVMDVGSSLVLWTHRGRAELTAMRLVDVGATSEAIVVPKLVIH